MHGHLNVKLKKGRNQKFPHSERALKWMSSQHKVFEGQTMKSLHKWLKEGKQFRLHQENLSTQHNVPSDQVA